MNGSLVEEAIHLVKSARDTGLELRLLGSVGVAFYVDSAIADRPATIKDIDLATRHERRRQVQEFLRGTGWEIAKELLMLSENHETYLTGRHEYSIDVYYDEIDANHRLSLKDRLDLSYPVIPWIDLLLSKLQRRYPRPEDTWDCCALLKVEPQRGDFEYYQQVVGRDWGLHTTVTENLTRLLHECPMLATRISTMLRIAVQGRKSWHWRLRALIGRRVKWWREVYDTKIRVSAEADT